MNASRIADCTLARRPWPAALAVACSTCLTAAGLAAANLLEEDMESVRQNNAVLYYDFANPADARGIALVNDKVATNWTRREIGGIPAVLSPQYLEIKLDPACVTNRMPLLLAIAYHDSGAWNDTARVYGIFKPGSRADGSMAGGTCSAYRNDWRWFTTLGCLPNRYQWIQGTNKVSAVGFNFWTGKAPLRYLLVLPVNDSVMKAIADCREKTLAMFVDYNRLMAAEAAFQYARIRLEQLSQYAAADRNAADNAAAAELTALRQEGEKYDREMRPAMDAILEEVIPVADGAYLGIFDGAQRATSAAQSRAARDKRACHAFSVAAGDRPDERLAAVRDFQRKVKQAGQGYAALTAKINAGIAAGTAARLAQQNIEPIALSAPPDLPDDRLVTRRDIGERFFFGLNGQTGLLGLPQANLVSLRRDNGIDFTYEYGTSFLIDPQEDGRYDFSRLDEMLADPKGMRFCLHVFSMKIPPWAQKRLFGEKPESQTQGKAGNSVSYRTREGAGKPPGLTRTAIPTPAIGMTVGDHYDAWSDAVMQYTMDFHRAVGVHFRTNPVVLRYKLNCEGGVENTIAAGYVFDAARLLFQERLQKKFRAIEKLNREFGTAYAGFDEIPLPKPAEGEKMVRLTPAYYEYVQLALERTQLARGSKCLALRAGDPDRAIGEVNSSWFGSSQVDNYKFAVDTPFDTFAAGDSDTRSCRYTYSLNRYNPRPIWMYEPYTYLPWRPAEGCDYAVEDATRHMLFANLWKWFFWDHQAIQFFNSRNTDWRSDITDYRLRDITIYDGAYESLRVNPALRLAAGPLGTMHTEFNRLRSVLKQAPVVPARIGVLESATTYAVPFPPRAIFQDLFTIQKVLERDGRHFFFMLETAILEKKENLAPYSLIVAAYATHLRPEVRDALLAWVKKGGTLIASGPLAVYDHYGRTADSFPEQVFGMRGIEYCTNVTVGTVLAQCSGPMTAGKGASLYAGKDLYWKLPSSNLLAGTKVLAALKDGTPVVVERACGQGKVIMTATSFGATPNTYNQLITEELDRIQPIPEAQSTVANLELQVREDKEGVRYLGIVNRNISAPVSAQITVAGEFPHPQDITVAQGCPIPVQCKNKTTCFDVCLPPGMGNFIRLGKPEKVLSAMSPARESEYLRLGLVADMLAKAEAMRLDTTADRKTWSEAQDAFDHKKYADTQGKLESFSRELAAKLVGARADAIKDRARDASVHPVAGTWACAYADIAKALLAQGKMSMAENRLALAERTLAERPAAKTAVVVFPFVTNRLDLANPATWPQEGWQVIYRGTNKTEAVGRFLLAGAEDGIYITAVVQKTNVVDKTQKAGGWRAMDGLVLALRCLDKTEKLSPEVRSEDTYEITFYADGSVLVWENALPDTTNLISNLVTKTADGYRVAGFIPAAAIRFRPCPGITVIMDAAISSHVKGSPYPGYVDYFWHGIYGKAETWARVQLGGRDQTTDDRRRTTAGKGITSTAEQTGDAAKMDAGVSRPGVDQAPLATETVRSGSVAEPCLEAGRWVTHVGKGIVPALASFDAAEVLPMGKKGAVVMVRPGQEDKAELMVQFEEIGKRSGVRVWLKGEGSGGEIELRVSGREGYSWTWVVPDKSRDWQAVEIKLDEARQTKEDVYSEEFGGHARYRPALNRLVVQLPRPVGSVKVGLIEYLE